MEYPSYMEKSSSWHLTGGGTKVKVSCALLGGKTKGRAIAGPDRITPWEFRKKRRK
jgi:hypothetical protein